MPESSCCVPRRLRDGCTARPTPDPARVGVAPRQTSPGRFIVRKAELGRRTSMTHQYLSPGSIRNTGQKQGKKIIPPRSHAQMNHRYPTQRHPGPPVLSWAALETFHVPVRNHCLRLLRASCLPLAVLALLAGCSSPAVRQQRLIARPNMTFSDHVAFSYNSPRLLSQFATGFGGSGAAQNSGCTSCR